MEMYAYIDESGDEGIGGKGTKWLIITAMIANQFSLKKSGAGECKSSTMGRMGGEPDASFGQ